MTKTLKLLVSTVLMAFLSVCSFGINAQPHQESFQQFLQKMAKRAEARGVSKATIDRYLLSIKPPKAVKHTHVLYLYHHEAQNVLTIQQYFHALLDPTRIRMAREKYCQHLPLLREVQRQYHVQPRFIVALWAIESDFGNYMGHYPLVRSMALLAYQPSRSAFFTQQLIDALIILDKPVVTPLETLSAFDGGMGQVQFEPSSYLSYAVDFDHDGHKNIWTSLPDVFASFSNYLHLNGWTGGQNWGFRVRVPANFPVGLASVYKKHTVAFWSRLGVTEVGGAPLPKLKEKVAILLPGGIKGPAFLVRHNFDVLLRWNNTTFEGLTIGLLADKILGVPPLKPISHG